MAIISIIAFEMALLPEPQALFHLAYRKKQHIIWLHV